MYSSEKKIEFRAFLIKLFNQLSDTDRQALHFSLGDQISRRHRDNSTPSGSLELLDSLFDQNLITEQNFDYLINLFECVNCHNVSAQLQEYKSCTVRTPTGVPVSLLFEDPSFGIESDKMRSTFNALQTQSSQSTPNTSESFIELERAMIPSSTITSFEDAFESDKHEKERLSSTTRKLFKKNRHLFSTILVIITILSVVLCIISFCLFLIRTTEMKRQPLSLIVKQELYYIMKEGLQYGRTNFFQNESFNDANDLALSYSDRCIGVELQWTNNSLISIQFLYSNHRSSSISIAQSKTTSLASSQFSTSFVLTPNEEINKINLYQGSVETGLRIVGIQFRTTNGRKSEVFGSSNGHFLTESFEFYTFGYAQGIQQKGKGVEMLQFVWIRQALAEEQMAPISRPMVEICQFYFTSMVDNQYVYARGVESSWYDLKRKFDRDGAGYRSTATYYEKISQRGPQLFAIVNDTFIFYHDKGEWYKYRSAEDISCDVIPWPESISRQESSPA